MSTHSDRVVTVRDIQIGNRLPFALIAGPCQIESEQHTIDTALRLKAIADHVGVPLIFKSSFDKANRSSISTSRGIGIEQGLKILQQVRDEVGVPVLTDVHDAGQCAEVGAVVDILQIPAFLCRQTDLLVAAAKTGKAVNVKKGQFLAPWDMKNVAEKIASTGNDQIMLCDRGTSFGYNTLISDFRGLPTMAETGYPVVFDATHSVQQPGGNGATSGGQRQFVKPLARAAVAIGVAALFIEAHEDPDRAPSDGPNMVRLDQLEWLLRGLVAIDKLTKAPGA